MSLARILFIAIKSSMLSLCALGHATAKLPYNISECSFVCLQLSWCGAHISEHGQCRRRPVHTVPDRVPQLTHSLRTTIASTPSQSIQPHHAHAKSRSSLVSSEWKKPIDELNCHLHPLDSFATASGTALTKLKPPGRKCLEVTALPPISFCR